MEGATSLQIALGPELIFHDKPIPDTGPLGSRIMEELVFEGGILRPEDT